MDFDEFCRFVGGITPARHQRRWIRALQEVGERPDGAKLIIVAPPGSGKTTILVLFAAWMIGRQHTRHLGYISYADRVAWGRAFAIRRVIEESKAYQLVFPEVRPDHQRWGTAEFQVLRPNLADPHPTLRAGGSTSAIVAYRLNGVIIDDPHDPKNSSSTEQREKVWENYAQAIRTRLTADSWQVVIATRWAEQDFVGRLQKQAGWRVIVLRALNSKGESYWPEEYPTADLLQRRYENPTVFATQYMANPAGDGGNIIRQVHYYDEPPQEALRRCDLIVASAWDTAFKRGEENDFSVGYVGGLDRYGRIYILDRLKGRWGLPELLEQINESTLKWQQFSIWIEDQASGQSALQVLMAEAPHLPTVPIKYSSDKVARAHALAPYLHGGHVLFPRGEPWVEDAVHYLTRFPHEDFDDDVDSLFILIDNLRQVVHPKAIRPRVGTRLHLR